MKNRLSIFTIVIIACLILFWLARYMVSIHAVPSLQEFMASSTGEMFASTTSVLSVTSSSSATVIKTPKGNIEVVVSADNISRQKGLGGIKSLEKDAGMLFVFEISGQYGFWMKDMEFPIDMVWIDDEKTVLGMSQNIPPQSFPKVFFPPAPIRYVLELNAGGAVTHGIATGTKLVF